MKAPAFLPHSLSLSTIGATKLVLLALYSVLMVRQSCPSWFLGLLVSATILLCMGLLAMKLPARGLRTSFSPLRIGHVSSILQFLWAVLLFAVPQLPSVPYSFGYFALSSLQLLVFFKYLFRFRLLLGRVMNPAMAPLPRLNETAT